MFVVIFLPHPCQISSQFDQTLLLYAISCMTILSPLFQFYIYRLARHRSLFNLWILMLWLGTVWVGVGSRVTRFNVVAYSAFCERPSDCIALDLNLSQNWGQGWWVSRKKLPSFVRWIVYNKVKVNIVPPFEKWDSDSNLSHSCW